MKRNVKLYQYKRTSNQNFYEKQNFQELLLSVKQGGVMLRSLNDGLPPLLDEIPVQYHADVFPLLAMDDQALQQELRQVFSPERWSIYETLLDRKKSASLTDEEERQLAELRREADIVMFRRIYAAVLLKRRGYALPAHSKMTCISSMR